MVRLRSLKTQFFCSSFTLFNCNSKINNALAKLDRNVKKRESTSFKSGDIPGYIYVNVF